MPLKVLKMFKPYLQSRIFLKQQYRCSHNLRSELLTLSDPIKSTKTDSTTVNKSISSHILESNGFISDTGNGLLTSLPLGKRVLDRLTKLVREEMNRIRGQEIELPALADIKLWHKSGREQLMGNELFKLTDRHGKGMCLGPTHEEVVTNLVARLSKSISSDCLGETKSLRLYQVTRKFRDESRPKHSLLRAREFLMKDMYSFHLSDECARSTYEEVNGAYERLFNRLDLAFVKAEASVGAMGGLKSHEFLIESEVGEDRVHVCGECGQSISNDLIPSEEQQKQDHCWCDKKSAKQVKRCIEVGHTFLLGDRYTKTFPLTINNKNTSSVQMGCYGIGVSRLMQACIEQRHSENKFPDWPFEIAPFQVAIIPAKKGSEFDEKSQKLVPYLYDMVDRQAEYRDDVLVDDRLSLTIGRRVMETKLIGVPLAVILGKTVENEQVEIVIVSDRMRNSLGKDKVFCHSRELGHVIRQIKNDYAYKLKMKQLMRISDMKE